MSWAPPYAAIDDLRSWLRIDTAAADIELLYCIETASRTVDRQTSRQFGQCDAAEARTYTAEYHRDICRYVIDIDDLMTTTGLIVAADNDGDGIYSDTITDYTLSPANAVPTGRPWTRIEVRPSSLVKPTWRHDGVKVTAKYGWPTIPQAIRIATLVQASRFYGRRDAAFGPLTSQRIDDVAQDWGPSSELDPDMKVSIAPYARLWAAA
jgi:hypothetical protein